MCKQTLLIFFVLLNPFTPKGFPVDKQNCLALDRVNSMINPVGTYLSERVRKEKAITANHLKENPDAFSI